MDERVFLYTPGIPVPEWDLQHRLPINLPVGPVCQDTATIFRINSTFMDVTDQPYMGRQATAIFTLVLALTAVAVVGFIGLIIGLSKQGLDGLLIFLLGFLLTFMSGFSYVAWRLGRDEFFSLKRRPIRFNRKEQKIYAIRRRRFFSKAGEGDVTWEVPWNEQAIFCVHRRWADGCASYHIRHYTVDDQGNVLRAFAIGRVWHGDCTLPGLLSQWNYWCEYMNRGPERLPKPALFMSEKETVSESFLFCMYAMCGDTGIVARVLLMPLILLLAAVRSLSMYTCRDPVWPKMVDAVSVVAPDDAFDQPSGGTPVGWGQTAVAREGGAWPREDFRKVERWQGEQDVMQNGLLWAEASAPTSA
jgi:hypothetical protein